MSLIGHWQLNDGSGSTASDVSGNGLDGTINGDPSWVASNLGGALAFDGAENYISVPDDAALRIIGDISILFWMRKDAEAADWARLVGKGESDYRNYGVWEEYDGKRILFQQYDRDNRYQLQLYSASELEIDTWYHVACVLNGATASIYIDGVLDASGTQSGVPPTTSDPLTIGYAEYFDYFSGTLDDIRLYNHALSASEISDIFGAGSP